MRPSWMRRGACAWTTAKCATTCKRKSRRCGRRSARRIFAKSAPSPGFSASFAACSVLKWRAWTTNNPRKRICSGSTDFNLWVLGFARTNHHRLKSVLLNPLSKKLNNYVSDQSGNEGNHKVVDRENIRNGEN